MSITTTNEERVLMIAVRDLLHAGLSAQWGSVSDSKRIPMGALFNQVDMLRPHRKLCMVELGSTSFEPLPDALTLDSSGEGGLTIKVITVRLYVFTNLLDPTHVSVGDLDPVSITDPTQKEPGQLDIEDEVLNVLNAQPFLNNRTLVDSWKVAAVNREQFKGIDPIVGSSIEISVRCAERDRQNP